MKAKNKIITAVLLSAGAAVGTALINKYIKMQPTVQASFGDIHENADVNGLMNEMANILEETQNSSIA